VYEYGSVPVWTDRHDVSARDVPLGDVDGAWMGDGIGMGLGLGPLAMTLLQRHDDVSLRVKYVEPVISCTRQRT
jgi:hypothetical protein